MSIEYTCKNCDNDFDIDIEPIIPAKISGPPEQCYPQEGGEIEPEECPECGTKVDPCQAYKQAEEQRRAYDEDPPDNYLDY